MPALAVVAPAARSPDDGDRAYPAGFNRREPSSGAPVDLAGILSGERHDPPPGILARVDGVCLLYAGRMHAMSAEPESGKGWAALHASAERIAAGQHVVYVDYEDTAANIVARLVALSVEHDAILSRFHYLRPEDPVTPQDVDALAELQPALVVVDGVTEALALEALDMANNQDVADFYKRLARPFATAGAAVLLIDHVVKDREARGRYAIGAQHKLAGADVAYKLPAQRLTNAARSPWMIHAPTLERRLEVERVQQRIRDRGIVVGDSDEGGPGDEAFVADVDARHGSEHGQDLRAYLDRRNLFSRVEREMYADPSVRQHLERLDDEERSRPRLASSLVESDAPRGCASARSRSSMKRTRINRGRFEPGVEALAARMASALGIRRRSRRRMRPMRLDWPVPERTPRRRTRERWRR